MKNKIAFLGRAVRMFAENNEPLEGGELKGLADLLDGVFCDIVEQEGGIGHEGLPGDATATL